VSELESTPGIPDTLGVSISGQANVTAHDIIGRDKIIHGDEYIGYTAAQVILLLDKIRVEYQTKPFDGRSPYIGLASFQERDADRFFGRETLTAELVTRVATSAASNARALFVAGPSGSGKSSLVRAGLIPALRRGAPLWSPALGSEHWLYETCKPGRAPLDELGLAVAKLARNADLRSAMTTRGLTDATFLNQQADMALTDERNQRAVLVIDQFEEIFTQLSPERENERVAFLEQLTHAATVENGRVLVIFTLRSDFVSNCASYPNLNALVNQQFIQVGAMSSAELVSAIARPAYQVGLRIDPALISQIVNDVRGEPGALPLMQFALQDLFEHEKQKGELTLDGYTARGGLHEALERHADAEFAKLDDAEKELARSVFSGLIEIGRGREDTKRTARFGELVPAGADEARVQALVRELADARLITTDEQDGKETVTLAHERLIDAWDWLRRLVDENRDAIALQNEIAQDAQEWEQQKRDESYLYRGARLATAQEKLQQNKLVLSGLAQEFVETALAARERERAEREAARQKELEQAQALAAEQKQRAEAEEGARRAAEKSAAAEKQRARVLRFAIAGVSFLAFLAILASCFAFQQQGVAQQEANQRATAQANADQRAVEAEQAKATAEAEAKIARSRELAALAQSEFESNPDLAVLLAAEINQEPNRSTFESQDALRQLLAKYPLESVFRGHAPRGVNSAQFSADGARVVTTSGDGTAQVWNASDGKRLVTLAHSDYVWRARFSSDDARIVTASWDNTARVWDAVSGKLIFILAEHRDRVNDAQFSPDNTRIVTASMDETARVWNAANGETLAVLRGHEGQVNRAEFSHDGKWILTMSFDDLTARVWDSANGKPLAVLRGHGDRLQGAHFSPDDNMIVTSSWDATARLWDAASGQPLALLGKHNNSVESAEFSPDGKYIVTASVDGTARVWEVAALLNDTDASEFSVLRGHTSSLRGARFSSDSQQILTMSDDHTVRVWNLLGKELGVLRGHERMINDAQFSRDGKWIVTASDDDTARVWNLAGGKELAVVRLPESQVVDADFCFQENKIAIASGATVSLRNMKNGAELVALRGHSAPVNRVRFSHDCAKIATASADETARIWDANTGKELVVLRGHKFQVHSAQFSTDDRKIVTGGDDKTARVWDVATGQELVALRGHKLSVAYAEFSGDGKWIVTAAGPAGDKSGDETARIWDAETGAEIIAFAGHEDYLTSAHFSSDGKKIVTTSNDRTARVWDIANQKIVANLQKHLAGVNTAQFSPGNGAQLVTASNDGTTRVWDIARREQLSILRGDGAEIINVRYSQNGDTLATVTKNGTVRVYLVNLQSLAKLAKDRIGRELTCEERVQYLREKNVCPTPTPAASPTP
jgi:WD40 repeat protein